MTQDKSWEEQFDEEFGRSKPLKFVLENNNVVAITDRTNYEDIKHFITKLLPQEKSQFLREIIGDRKDDKDISSNEDNQSDQDNRIIGYNQKRQEILDRAKERGVEV